MRQILGFIGITNVNAVLAGGTLVIDMGKRRLPTSLAVGHAVVP
jgi:FMN-dependent NADH-azoreductase